jgi:hypothetical protein
MFQIPQVVKKHILSPFFKDHIRFSWLCELEETILATAGYCVVLSATVLEEHEGAVSFYGVNIKIQTQWTTTK